MRKLNGHIGSEVYHETGQSAIDQRSQSNGFRDLDEAFDQLKRKPGFEIDR